MRDNNFLNVGKEHALSPPSVEWVFMIATGCSPSGSTQAGLVVEPYLPDDGSVFFDVQPIDRPDGSVQLKASYPFGGKTARFSIELGAAKRVSSEEARKMGFTFGQGRFVAEEGSDASALLVALYKALEVKEVPKPGPRIKSLPFEFVNLGEHQSQAPGGGFTSDPPGNWTLTKMFLGDDDQGEVFLNFNRVIKKGVFSIKDSDYGDYVIAELAKVL